MLKWGEFHFDKWKTLEHFGTSDGPKRRNEMGRRWDNRAKVMPLFFINLIRGHIRRHRLEALLCLIGVALGVAVVVAIEAAVTASTAVLHPDAIFAG